MALYELAVLGSPTAAQLDEFEAQLRAAADSFKLALGAEIIFHIHPAQFLPTQTTAAAAVFFGGKNSTFFDVASVLNVAKVPIVPVASTEKLVSAEIPAALRMLNCLYYDQGGSHRVVSALLGCVGLLPRQRRVFLSYRREEATPAAVQLFAAFSARNFDVFLDTHSIEAAVDFQEYLWHQLCDVDVLVMLETPRYFKSRWTMAEYGRALAKGIGVLRIEWPDSTPSIHTQTASRAEIVPQELLADGSLAKNAVERICQQLERERVVSHAARHLSLIDAVSNAVTRIGGQVTGLGTHRSVHVTLASGRELVVQPIIGIPTSVTLQDAIDRAGACDAAVVYDHLGIKQSWERHLKWLAGNIPSARWVKATDAAWDFAGWEI